VLLIVLAALLSGCIAQDPPGSDFVNDVNNDFQNEDYFNP
jgi:hypothetical protein